MKQSIAMLCLSFALTVLPACATPVTYSAEPIEAWIIDAGTKQPLEGVIVIAHWVLEGGIHVDRVGELVILETVTDKNGRFYFSGWGPIRHWKRSRLTNMDPEFLIFKNGYEYQRLANPSTKEAIEGKPYPVHRSVWNGKTIALKSFKGTPEEYAEHVHQLDNDLEWARYGKDCEWKQIPQMLVAIHRLSEQFESQGIKLKGWRGGARIRKVTHIGKQDQCGSAAEFFRIYLP